MAHLSNKKEGTCKHCGDLFFYGTSYVGKYCSNKCQMAYQTSEFIQKWKNGEVDGGAPNGRVKTQVKNYLREKYGNKCALCGWSKVNPHTHLVPLNADHIDGDWTNSVEENLRLLCGCCDSLQETYCGGKTRNKRKGRPRGNYKRLRL